MRPNGDGTSSSDTRMSGIELGGALRELSRIDRLLLADIAGAHRLQHEVAQRHRRAHQGEKPIHRCRRIGRIYSGDARPVGKLVDERRFILAQIRTHERPSYRFRGVPGMTELVWLMSDVQRATVRPAIEPPDELAL